MGDYVERRHDGYYVTGTRISLDSIVHEFRHGAAPESILRAFPLLGSLERVYGAITYYLAHKSEIDGYLERQEAIREAERARQRLPEDLKRRLDRARQDIHRRS